MTNPQLSRKEEIEKGCGKKGWYPNYLHIECVKLYIPADNNYLLCPTCQARLDERIRAEQDFLKEKENIIDEIYFIFGKIKGRLAVGNLKVDDLQEELKSTIQKEKTNG
jgi:hypothetical protein